MSAVTCIMCGHGPHQRQPCAGCGCKEFINAELVAFRGLASINNILIQKIPVFENMLFDLLELLTEVYPEAVLAVDAKREARRKAHEDQTASQYQGTAPDSPGEDSGPSGSDGEKVLPE